MKEYDNEVEVHRSHGGGGQMLAGLVIGTLAGAGAMLLLAPKSGQEMRQQLLEETDELRERAGSTVDEAVGQIRAKTGQIKSDLQEKAVQLDQQGRELIADQLERVSAAAEAGKAAVKK